MKNYIHVFIGLAAALVVASAQAALFDRGNGLIYDSDRNITWLKNWNASKDSAYDSDGLMNWFQAKAWADTLYYGGYDDWRLPITVQPDPTCSHTVAPWNGFPAQSFGLHCLGSEMGHLWYEELGNNGALTTAGLFFNFETSLGYWSGTQYGQYCGQEACAWSFQLADGRQVASISSASRYAVAVRDGDVLSNTNELPVPSTLLLAGLAMACFGGARLHKNRKP